MQISTTSHKSECINPEIFPRGKAAAAWHRIIVLHRDGIVIVSAHHRQLCCGIGGSFGVEYAPARTEAYFPTEARRDQGGALCSRGLRASERPLYLALREARPTDTR